MINTIAEVRANCTALSITQGYNEQFHPCFINRSYDLWLSNSNFLCFILQETLDFPYTYRYFLEIPLTQPKKINMSMTFDPVTDIQLINRFQVQTICIRQTLVRYEKPQKDTCAYRSFFQSYSNFSKILAHSTVYPKKSKHSILI